MSRRTYTHSIDRLLPLWVWGLVACLLVLSFASYKLFFEQYLGGLATFGNAFITVNSERLQKFSKNQDSDGLLKVVSIGTSLTRNATYAEYDDNLSALKTFSESGIQLLNISQAGGRFNQFSALLPEIVEVNPDVIIVHSDLLRKVQIMENKKNVRRHIRRWFRDLPLFGPSKNQDFVKRERQFQSKRVCHGRPATINNKKADRIADRYSGNVVLDPAFNELIEQAQERGIRIVVLHVSRQYLFRQHYSQALSQWEDRLQTALAPFKGISRWVSPMNFDQEDYCDYTHFNDTGREKFTSWLLPKLRDLAVETSQP